MYPTFYCILLIFLWRNNLSYTATCGPLHKTIIPVSYHCHNSLEIPLNFVRGFHLHMTHTVTCHRRSQLQLHGDVTSLFPSMPVRPMVQRTTCSKYDHSCTRTPFCLKPFSGSLQEHSYTILAACHTERGKICAPPVLLQVLIRCADGAIYMLRSTGM